MSKNTYKYSIAFMSCLVLQSAQAKEIKITEQLISDAFNCKVTLDEAVEVYSYLYENKDEMTDDEVQKIDFPSAFDKINQKITVHGFSSYYVNNQIGAEGEFVKLSLMVPNKNSFETVEKSAKILNAKSDAEFNDQAKAMNLKLRSYQISQSKKGKFTTTQSISNNWAPDEQHNPWPLVELSCQYEKN